MYKIALIGFGSIAPHYLQALRVGMEMGWFKATICAVANRTEAGNKRAIENGISKTYLNIEEMIQKEKPDAIFCLVNAFNLYRVALELIPHGIPILIEKPPGMTAMETSLLADLALKSKTNVMVALNRRFYSIVEQAKQLCQQHGGLLGIRMDGFERFKFMEERGFPPSVLEGLLYTNTIHCIDLIRHYAGDITRVSSFSSNVGSHPFRHRYASLMSSVNNIPITFQAYWHSLGNWRYELYIPNGRIVFSNLETAALELSGQDPLHLQLAFEDTVAKPGFVRQISFFLQNVVACGQFYEGPLSLRDAIGTMELIEQIDSLKGLRGATEES